MNHFNFGMRSAECGMWETEYRKKILTTDTHGFSNGSLDRRNRINGIQDQKASWAYEFGNQERRKHKTRISRINTDEPFQFRNAECGIAQARITRIDANSMDLIRDAGFENGSNRLSAIWY